MLRNLNVSSGGTRKCGSPKVGVLVDDIPTGFTLPSFLENDIDVASPTRRYKLTILTRPIAGVLYVKENGSGTFAGAPEGVYTGTQKIERYDPGVGLAATNYGAYTLTVQGSGGTVHMNTVRASFNAAYQVAPQPGANTLVRANWTASYYIAAPTPNTLVRAMFDFDYELAAVDTTLHFSPSHYRTILVTGNSAKVPFQALSDFWNMANAKRPKAVKDPDETFDITFNWIQLLTDGNDKIGDQGMEFLSDGLVIEGMWMRENTNCTVSVSGGKLNSMVSLTNRITTDSNPPRKYDRTVYFIIEQS